MSGQLGAWLAAAVLGCWCLGAYNRLVRLRQTVAAAFRAVAEALDARHRHAGAWLAATRPAADDPTPMSSWQAAEAALRQAQAAADHAVTGSRTADAALLDSLALADRVLRGALSQWAAAQGDAATTADAARDARQLDPGMPREAAGDEAAPSPARAGGPEAAALATAETALDAARTGFNALAGAYNEALRLFPTRIVGWLFGFHVAGRL